MPIAVRVVEQDVFDKWLAAVKEDNHGLPARFVADFPDTFPLIRDLHVTPDNHLVVELWPGRPDQDERLMVFDFEGREKNVPMSLEKLNRWVTNVGSWSYITCFDGSEEAYLVRVEKSLIDKVIEAIPTPEDAPQRSIRITIGG